MKTHAALALVTAIALTAPGCGTTHPVKDPLVGPCPCKKPHKENTVSVIVEFTTDAEGKPIAKTGNKTAYVCEGDTVEFIWSTGKLSDPVFEYESPFDGSFAPRNSEKKKEMVTGASKKSGKVKQKAKKGSYDYKMLLQVENVFYDVDPRIEVME